MEFGNYVFFLISQKPSSGRDKIMAKARKKNTLMSAGLSKMSPSCPRGVEICFDSDLLEQNLSRKYQNKPNSVKLEQNLQVEASKV